MSTPLVSYQIAGDVEDLSPVASILAERKTAFLDDVLDQSKACTNSEHFWVNQRLVGFIDGLSADIADGTSNVTVQVNGKNSANIVTTKYVPKTVIMIDDEYFQVVSVDEVTNAPKIDLTCTRQFGGTTHTAHTAGARVTIISKPKPEGHQPTDNEAEKGSRDSNYTQIFDRKIDISYTTKNVKQVAAEGDIKAQIKNKMNEMLKELEISSLYGLKTADGSGDNRTMGGVIPKVKALGSSNSKNLSNSAITVDDLDDAIFALLEIGIEPDKIYAANSQKKMLNALQQDRFKQAQTQDTKKLTNVVGTYGAEHGDMPVVLCNSLRPGDILISTTENLKVFPLQNSGFQMEALAKTGLRDEAMAWGEFSMEIRLPESHFYLYGAATT